jgi:hypothetical protein
MAFGAIQGADAACGAKTSAQEPGKRLKERRAIFNWGTLGRNDTAPSPMSDL